MIKVTHIFFALTVFFSGVISVSVATASTSYPAFVMPTLDLDTNAPGLDWEADTLCAQPRVTRIWEGGPSRIDAIPPIDSLWVNLQNPQAGEQLTWFSAAFPTSQNPTGGFWLRNASGAANADFWQEVTEQLGYVVSTVQTPGPRQVAMVTAGAANVGDTVFTTFFIGAATVQSFSIDTVLCSSDTITTLSAIAGAPAGGNWFFNGNAVADVFNPSMTSTGLYDYYQNDQFCGVDTSMLRVGVRGAPLPALGADFNVCDGDTVILEVLNQLANWTLNWSDGSIDTFLQVTETGQYSVTVTETDGCTGSDDIQVTFAQRPFAADTTVACAGDSVNLNGFFIMRDTSICASFPVGLSCDSVYCQEFQFLPAPQPVLNQSTVHLCGNETQTVELLNAQPMTTFLWSDGVLTANRAFATAGTYTLTATNAAGCFGTAEVVVTASPPVVFEYAVTDARCEGAATGTFQLDRVTGISNTAVLLLNADTVQVGVELDSLFPGDYSLQLLDTFGCVFDTMVVVDAALNLALSIGEDRTISLGDSVQLQAQTNFLDYSEFQWSPEPLSTFFNGLAAWVMPIGPTTYSLELRDSLGCSATASVVIQVNREIVFFAPNAFSPDGNERNDVWQIFLSPAIRSIDELFIFDRWGGLVFEGTPDNNRWDGFVNGERASSGVYTWAALIQLADNTQERISGDITLIR